MALVSRVQKAPLVTRPFSKSIEVKSSGWRTMNETCMDSVLFSNSISYHTLPGAMIMTQEDGEVDARLHISTPVGIILLIRAQYVSYRKHNEDSSICW